MLLPLGLAEDLLKRKAAICTGIYVGRMAFRWLQNSKSETRSNLRRGLLLITTRPHDPLLASLFFRGFLLLGAATTTTATGYQLFVYFSVKIELPSDPVGNSEPSGHRDQEWQDVTIMMRRLDIDRLLFGFWLGGRRVRTAQPMSSV
jgi:hypothetical protein